MINYNDFKFLNYNKTNHKIKKLRDLVDRLYGDYEYKKILLDGINLRIKTLIPTPTITPPVENLPDLVVLDITSIDRGHYLEFTITVKNIGDVATEDSCILKVNIEDLELELNVPILDVNASAECYASYPYDAEAGNTYSLAVNAEVDSDNIIAELNESNNSLTENFTIKEGYNISGIIVHIHIPEGYEYGVYSGYPMTMNGFTVYIDDVSVINQYDVNTHHNIPIETATGLKIIKIEAPGFSLSQAVTVIENEVSIVVFELQRTEIPVTYHGYVEDYGGYLYTYEHIISEQILYEVPDTIDPPGSCGGSRFEDGGVVYAIFYCIPEPFAIYDVPMLFNYSLAGVDLVKG